jgi:hypothetical protein
MDGDDDDDLFDSDNAPLSLAMHAYLHLLISMIRVSLALDVGPLLRTRYPAFYAAGSSYHHRVI